MPANLVPVPMEVLPASPFTTAMRGLDIPADTLRLALGSGVPLAQLAGENMLDQALTTEVVDHIRLSPRFRRPLDYTQHHPHALANQVDQVAATGQAVKHLKISGRLIDMDTQVQPAPGGGYSASEVVSVVDSSQTNGEFWMEAKALEALLKGEYSPFVDPDVIARLRYNAAQGKKEDIGRLCSLKGYAIFRQNTDLKSPLAHRGHPYNEQGDWELAAVMTSTEASPEDGGIDFGIPKQYARDEGGKLLLGPDGKPIIDQDADEVFEPYTGLLSSYADNYEERLRGKFHTKKGFRSFVDSIMAAANRMFETKPDGTLADPTYDYRSDRRLSPRAKDHMGIFVNSPNPMDSRIPWRGWTQMELIRRYEESHPNLSKEARAHLEGMQDKVRSEVVQALAMTQMEHVMRGVAAAIKPVERPAPVEPIRWQMQLVDHFDRKFARRLGAAYKNPPAGTPPLRAKAARAIAQQYAMIPKQAELMILATPGNALEVRPASGDGGELRENYVYGQGASTPFTTAEGVYPQEAVQSVYADELPLMMDGMMCRLRGVGEGIDREDNNNYYLFVDLNRAPARIAQWILGDKPGQLNYLARGGSGIGSRSITLSEMLDVPTERRDLYVIRSTASKIAIEGIIEPDSAAALALSKDGRRVEVLPRKLESEASARRRSAGNELTKAEEDDMAGRVVATKTPDQAVREQGKIILGSIVYHAGAVFARENPGSGAVMKVMRSQGRLAE